MTGADAALLRAIEALSIDPPGVALRFVDRLARENGWTAGHAAAAMREYRRRRSGRTSGPASVGASSA